MMTDMNPNTLSEQGRLRRGSMLDELLEQMQQVHHKRQRRRRLGTVGMSLAVVMMVVVGAFMINHRSSNTQITLIPVQPIAGLNSHQVTPSTPSWQLVSTDPQIVNRYRSTAKPRAMMVDDQALLETLAELNRPTGLIQLGQRVYLTASVTDEALRRERTTTKPASSM